MSKEEEEIEKLKQIALRKSPPTDNNALKSAVDAIASYGDKAIPTLIEIGDRGSIYVQHQALEWVAKIRAEAKEKAEAYKKTHGW